jgi:putative FmdB family regulatory protein
MECGYIFEQININKVTKMIVKCPNCEKKAKKIISKSSFVIKGYSEKNRYSKE